MYIFRVMLSFLYRNTLFIGGLMDDIFFDVIYFLYMYKYLHICFRCLAGIDKLKYKLYPNVCTNFILMFVQTCPGHMIMYIAMYAFY